MLSASEGHSGESVPENFGERRYFCHDSILRSSSRKPDMIWFTAVQHEII